MNKPTRIAIIVALAILLLIGGVYGFRAYANSRKLDALQTKAAEMFSQPRDANSSNSPGNGEQRRDGYREIRQQVETLPEAYQQQFRQSMGNMFMQREEQRMDEYLSLNKVERKKYLDKRIVEGEQRRKEWEARRKQFEAERAKEAAAGTGTQNGGNAQGNNSGGDRGRGGWGGRSQSARLDRTSPEFRAKRAEYRRDMEQRRKELGLPAGGWGRR